VKKMCIIGAGIAGLSTGCYAQMNGYDSEIYEMHNTPGGVCTSWKRGDYLFDHCLHWVIGSNKGSSIYPIFEELGIAENVEFYHTERFRKIEMAGKSLTVYTNVDRLENELLRLFPDDEKAIRKLVKLVRFYRRFRPPLDADFGSFSLHDILKMLPFMPSFLKLKNTRIEDFLSIFHNRDLREMLFQMFPVKKMPALMVVMPLAYFHNHEGGYPMGGSLHFTRAIEKRYVSLGGEINYNQKIKKILVEDGKAVGIETGKGKRILADIIVSACDGRSVVYDMLEGKYLTSQVKKIYEKPSLWPPIISISLGVNRDLSGEVEINCFKLDKPVLVGNRKCEWMGYFHFCHDPAFAPTGKSVIKIQIESDYDYWRSIYKDKHKYRMEKEKVLNICLRELENKLPGIAEQIETTDIATPVTWERYTGNWRGSYQGWLPTIELFGKFLPRELPKLRNFYMTGQWTFPGGGVPMCMAQARRLIKYLCKKEKKEFVSII
jgi:phytoene dehydrogenase-like protein